ncbi:uncharacterized protein SCHCODRAFT_02673327 [Schizophyllum commune H4-8]|nr:uncharacterized protein SCHCODRAFT_02673327 [Schizophyllum commune H4-8]KAI5885593.1 hypothetical protein SCHCODRAFT_02673327 [Schizophyllum commune H4-8]
MLGRDQGRKCFPSSRVPALPSTPRSLVLALALALALALLLRFHSSLYSTYWALARRAAPFAFGGRRPASARRASITLASPGPFSVDIHDGKMRISTSIAPRPAREFLAEHCDMTDVGRGARAARRREAPSQTLRLIHMVFCARFQMQNFCILTRNAPRAARESLAERRELSNAREGARTRRRRRRGAPPSLRAAFFASCKALRCVSCPSLPPFPDDLEAVLGAPPDAKLAHSDVKCAEVRAGIPSGPLRVAQRGGGGGGGAARVSRSSRFSAPFRTQERRASPSKTPSFARGPLAKRCGLDWEEEGRHARERRPSPFSLPAFWLGVMDDLSPGAHGPPSHL